MKQKRIPNIGDILPAFDDGKVRFSRLYETKIISVIPFDASKEIMVKGFDNQDMRLSDVWAFNIEEYDWLFADETDFIIEAYMKNEVANPNYFARTKDGGWFSLNVQSYLQGASLDSDLELYKYMITEGYGSPSWAGDAYKKVIKKYNKMFGLDKSNTTEKC